MIAEQSRFDGAMAAFDEANGEDPNVVVDGGATYPKELLYARRMSGWLDRLVPDASEALRLAARCQNIRRWEIPRRDYPMDRAGYLKWRTDLKHFHARLAGEILARVGYDDGTTADGTIARVQSLLRKERLKRDPESQQLEDVVCLVFLENQLVEFAEKHAEEKVVDIVRKTWTKMSPAGHQAALALALPPEARALIEKALQGA